MYSLFNFESPLCMLLTVLSMFRVEKAIETKVLVSVLWDLCGPV